MTRYLMPSADAVALLGGLQDHGVDVCLSGGWGVDALLGEQTREHADLDLWAPAAQVPQLFVSLVAQGVDRIFPWPGDRPWNFVLHDGASLRVDLHLYEKLDDDTVHFGSVTDGVTFPTAALGGRGRIDGTPVRCEAPEWAVRWHTGYPPRDVDRHDVPLLCARFGVPLPFGFD
jgi:lincosamide nucleotidyltransferase A/C/D/E